jgi:hypothetical protein
LWIRKAALDTAKPQDLVETVKNFLSPLKGKDLFPNFPLFIRIGFAKQPELHQFPHPARHKSSLVGGAGPLTQKITGLLC